MILKNKIKYLDHLLLKNNFINFLIKDSNTSNNIRQLKEKFNYLVNLLLKKKFKKDDRVLIISNNRTEVFIIQFAVSYLGGVSSMIDDNLKDNALNYIINDFDPKFLFIDKKKNIPVQIKKTYLQKIFFKDLKFKKKNLKKIVFKRNKKDLAIVIYTSGSTGTPKGIMCSHENILFSIYSIQNSLKYNNRDNIAVFLPISFDYGLYQIYMGLISNSKIFLAKTNEISFNYFNYLKKNFITVLPLVSSHLKILLLQLRNNKSLLKIRLITNTGSDLRHDLVSNLLKIYKKIKIFSMYGLTECKRVSILDSQEYSNKSNSVGKPIKGTKCWVINNKGKKINKIGIKGELVVKGKNVMMGYLNDERLTNKTFKKHGRSNILLTGDICSIDKKGYLSFYGRKDDIFKYKDYRLSKKEIEKNINEIKDIQDTFVYVSKNFTNYTIFIVTRLKLETAIKKIKNKLENYKFTENILKIKLIKRDQRGKVSKDFINKLIK